MRLKLIAALFLGSLAAAAHATTITYGPVTFGGNSPLLSEGFNSQVNLLQTYTPGVFLDIPFSPGSASFNQSIGFSFDLAPGWTISAMTFNDFTDYGTNQQNNQNWGYEYAQKVTLCPSTGGCWSASTGGHQGGFALPTISLNGQPGANAGMYQAAGYSYNAQVGTKPAESNLNIWLTQTAVAPEPSSFVLFGTGALGLLGALKRRLTSR